MVCLQLLVSLTLFLLLISVILFGSLRFQVVEAVFSQFEYFGGFFQQLPAMFMVSSYTDAHWHPPLLCWLMLSLLDLTSLFIGFARVQIP